LISYLPRHSTTSRSSWTPMTRALGRAVGPGDSPEDQGVDPGVLRARGVAFGANVAGAMNDPSAPPTRSALRPVTRPGAIDPVGRMEHPIVPIDWLVARRRDETDGGAHLTLVGRPHERRHASWQRVRAGKA
jgi:hypothetical protein